MSFKGKSPGGSCRFRAVLDPAWEVTWVWGHAQSAPDTHRAPSVYARSPRIPPPPAPCLPDTRTGGRSTRRSGASLHWSSPYTRRGRPRPFPPPVPGPAGVPPTSPRPFAPPFRTLPSMARGVEPIERPPSPQVFFPAQVSTGRRQETRGTQPLRGVSPDGSPRVAQNITHQGLAVPPRTMLGSATRPHPCLMGTACRLRARFRPGSIPLWPRQATSTKTDRHSADLLQGAARPPKDQPGRPTFQAVTPPLPVSRARPAHLPRLCDLPHPTGYRIRRLLGKLPSTCSSRHSPLA